jgi:hypothetical protein
MGWKSLLLISNPRKHQKVAILLVMAALLAGQLPVLAASAPSERVVVIGDIHGDLERLTSLLELSGLLDSQNKWVGGNSNLVITGDMTDRGSQVRAVMDLLIQLEKDASKRGGRVVTLMGNHEMMNIVGDLRYVTEEIYNSFADKKSEKRRKDAYKKHLKLLRRQAKNMEQPPPDDTPELENEWMEAHPLGFVEYRKAISSNGKYGRWLRKLPAVVKIGEAIFLHGGIHPSLTDFDLDEINKRVKLEVKNFDFLKKHFVQERLIADFYTYQGILAAVKARMDLLANKTSQRSETEKELLGAILEMGGWLTFNAKGPLWFRGYGRWTEEEGTQQVVNLLQRYKARYFVVGHTIKAERDILSRFGGRVFLVDTLLPSALQIQGDQFVAIYPDGKETLGETSLFPLSGDGSQATAAP